MLTVAAPTGTVRHRPGRVQLVRSPRGQNVLLCGHESRSKIVSFAPLLLSVRNPASTVFISRKERKTYLRLPLEPEPDLGHLRSRITK
jgi:hypothetical protein